MNWEPLGACRVCGEPVLRAWETWDVRDPRIGWSEGHGPTIAAYHHRCRSLPRAHPVPERVPSGPMRADQWQRIQRDSAGLSIEREEAEAEAW